MIKHLIGEHETVEYDTKKYVMLYDNVENEEYPVHWHDAVELIMPIKAEYAVNVGGKEFKLPEYDVLIIPPGELHSMPPIPGRRLIFQCDNKVLSNVTVLEPIMKIISAPFVINNAYNRDLHALAKKCMLDILQLYDSKSELSDTKIYIKIIELFTALSEHQIEIQKDIMDCDEEKLVEYNEKFEAVLKFIDTNYMYDITLDECADVAGYSKFHFSRIFKQYNSVTYMQYINIKRTKAAEKLLMQPNLAITNVAMMSGFKSLTTFNRIFKSIKHCTPTDYKKLYSAQMKSSLS